MEKGFRFIGGGREMPATWKQVDSTFDCVDNTLAEYVMRFPDCQLDIHTKFSMCQLLALEFQ